MDNPTEVTNKDSESKDDGREEKKKFVVRSATDLQRIRLEKLMKNPAKPVVIPESPREKDHLGSVPSFVRNVMGSSAGAGSGEFHVYRHLRRKEYARQKHIQEASKREQMDTNYQDKLEENRKQAENKTAKKRAKRLKKKAKAKERAKQPRMNVQKDTESESEKSSDEEDKSGNEDTEKDDKVSEKTESEEPSQIGAEDSTEAQKEEEKSKSANEKDTE